jgi:hypothetical protein
VKERTEARREPSRFLLQILRTFLTPLEAQASDAPPSHPFEAAS